MLRGDSFRAEVFITAKNENQNQDNRTTRLMTKNNQMICGALATPCVRQRVKMTMGAHHQRNTFAIAKATIKTKKKCQRFQDANHVPGILSTPEPPRRVQPGGNFNRTCKDWL